jgi:hypothetical protein
MLGEKVFGVKQENRPSGMRYNRRSAGYIAAKSHPRDLTFLYGHYTLPDIIRERPLSQGFTYCLRNSHREGHLLLGFVPFDTPFLSHFADYQHSGTGIGNNRSFAARF